jgi:hypothetical protein
MAARFHAMRSFSHPASISARISQRCSAANFARPMAVCNAGKMRLRACPAFTRPVMRAGACSWSSRRRRRECRRRLRSIPRYGSGFPARESTGDRDSWGIRSLGILACGKRRISGMVWGCAKMRPGFLVMHLQQKNTAQIICRFALAARPLPPT